MSGKAPAYVAPLAPRRRIPMPREERDELAAILSASGSTPLALKTAAIDLAAGRRASGPADPDHERAVLASLVGDGKPSRKARASAEEEDASDDDVCECDHDRAVHERGTGPCTEKDCGCQSFEAVDEPEAARAAAAASPQRFTAAELARLTGHPIVATVLGRSGNVATAEQIVAGLVVGAPGEARAWLSGAPAGGAFPTHSRRGASVAAPASPRNATIPKLVNGEPAAADIARAKRVPFVIKNANGDPAKLTAYARQLVIVAAQSGVPIGGSS